MEWERELAREGQIKRAALREEEGRRPSTRDEMAMVERMAREEAERIANSAGYVEDPQGSNVQEKGDPLADVWSTGGGATEAYHRPQAVRDFSSPGQTFSMSVTLEGSLRSWDARQENVFRDALEVSLNGKGTVRAQLKLNI